MNSVQLTPLRSASFASLSCRSCGRRSVICFFSIHLPPVLSRALSSGRVLAMLAPGFLQTGAFPARKVHRSPAARHGAGYVVMLPARPPTNALPFLSASCKLPSRLPLRSPSERVCCLRCAPWLLSLPASHCLPLLSHQMVS